MVTWYNSRLPFDINVMLNLSSDATGNHEIIKQGRANQFYLSVHQTRDQDGQTNSHSICTHFSFFWSRMQVNLLSRQTKQSICKKNKTQFQQCTKYGAIGNWTLEYRYQRGLSMHLFSRRKHPLLLALRRWGRFAKHPQRRRAGRNGCFLRLASFHYHAIAISSKYQAQFFNSGIL